MHHTQIMTYEMQNALFSLLMFKNMTSGTAPCQLHLPADAFLFGEDNFILCYADMFGYKIEMQYLDDEIIVTFYPSNTEMHPKKENHTITFDFTCHYPQFILSPKGIFPGDSCFQGIPSTNAMIELLRSGQNEDTQVLMPVYSSMDNAVVYEKNDSVSTVLHFHPDLYDPATLSQIIWYNGVFLRRELMHGHLASALPFSLEKQIFGNESMNVKDKIMNDMYLENMDIYTQITGEDYSEIMILTTELFCARTEDLLRETIDEVQYVMDTKFDQILLTAYKMMTNDETKSVEEILEIFRRLPSDGKKHPFRFQFLPYHLWQLSVMMSYYDSTAVDDEGCFSVNIPFAIQSEELHQALSSSLQYHCIREYFLKNKCPHERCLSNPMSPCFIPDNNHIFASNLHLVSPEILDANH